MLAATVFLIPHHLRGEKLGQATPDWGKWSSETGKAHDANGKPCSAAEAFQTRQAVHSDIHINFAHLGCVVHEALIGVFGVGRP